MSEVLDINHKTYLPVSAAARTVSYSRDHITRLARDQKIRSVLVGRQWYVEPTSLQSYIESADLEQAIRKRHLSADRKEERAMRERLSGVASQLDGLTARLSGAVRAAWWSGSALALGVGVGAVLSAQSLVPTLPHIPAFETQVSTVVVPSQQVVTSLPGEFSVDTIPVVFTPSAELELLPTNGIGVLLLPGTAPSVEDTLVISEMFSDPVVVRRDENGVRVVTAVDEAGVATGEGVPFITVPITHVEE